MKRISKAFWIWCEFETKDQDFLLKIRDSLLKSFESPDFSLHLTLAGPFTDINLKEMEKINLICKKAFLIDLDCFGIDSG